MEEKILITTVDRIKEITSISNNIDPSQLEPYLYTAQDMYVEDLLGADMYNDLLDNVFSGTTKYTFLIKNYLDYVIAYGAWSLASPFLNYKTQKKGIVKQNSDNSDNINIDEFNIYSKRIENTMTHYITKTIKYLEDNKTQYSLYKNNDNYNTNSSNIFLNY